jgi:hypothetical protein
MLKVDDLTQYVTSLVLRNEETCGENNDEETLFESLIRTKNTYGLPAGEDGDEFPAEAYTEAEKYCEDLITTISITATKNLIRLLAAISALPDDADESQIRALKESSNHSGLAVAHLMQIARPALELVDYEHVAQRAVDLGRKKAESAGAD